MPAERVGVRLVDDQREQLAKQVRERYSWTADDFGSVRGETEWVMTFARGDWSTRVETRQVLTCTPTEFRLHARLDAFEGQTRVCSRNWDHTVPRDLV